MVRLQIILAQYSYSLKTHFTNTYCFVNKTDSSSFGVRMDLGTSFLKYLTRI